MSKGKHRREYKKIVAVLAASFIARALYNHEWDAFEKDPNLLSTEKQRDEVILEMKDRICRKGYWRSSRPGPDDAFWTKKNQEVVRKLCSVLINSWFNESKDKATAAKRMLVKNIMNLLEEG
jgi:hypothetical protein